MSAVRITAVAALLAAALAAVTLAVWPASEAEKAREDGERLGEAVSALYAAETPSDVNAAVADVRIAAADTRDHAGEAIADEVADFEDAVERAADGFAGMHTADDEFEADLYEAELEVAVDDLDAQAEALRTEGPEVAQAFWEGYDSAVSAA